MESRPQLYKSASPVPGRRMRTLITQHDTSFNGEGEEDLLNEDEEKKEVSMQLSLIRKKHDQARDANLKKKAYLEKLKQEIEKLDSVTQVTECDQKSLQARIEQLQEQLEATKLKQQEELQNKRIYEHMLDRMKQEKISLEKKATSLQHNLKSARYVLETEEQRSRKTNETKFQSRLLLKELKESIDIEKKKKEERIQMLEKNIRMRNEAALRREERQKRQAEIAEAAANDDKDSQEVKMKESLLVHRFWYNFLKWKLDHEMQKSVAIEEAFQQIKTATGLQDIQEIVEKFLTKEQTYNELLQAVAEAEKKLETLRTENVTAREQLRQLQILDAGGNPRTIYHEIEELENELQKQTKEYNSLKDQLQKAVIVYDQVLDWAQKIMQRLDIKTDLEVAPGSKIHESKNSLADLFYAIVAQVKVLLKPVIDKKEESKQEMERQAAMKTDDLIVSSR